MNTPDLVAGEVVPRRADAVVGERLEAELVSPATGLLFCRECCEGKHRNCDDTAWSNELDAVTACTCPHPDHRARRAAAAITSPQILRAPE